MTADLNIPQEQLGYGAFTFDICDSTERVEKFGHTALKHHRDILVNAARNFYQTENDPTDQYRRGDIWVPGDALWGVCLSSPQDNVSTNIESSIWKFVTSIASALTQANKKAKEYELPDIKVKGVFAAGKILREEFLGNFTLYNGTALNICGRLEKEAIPNSLILAVTSQGLDENWITKWNNGFPIIYTSEFRNHLRICPLPEHLVQIKLPTIKDDAGHQCLSFQSWPVPRGFSDLRLFTLQIEIKEIPHEAAGYDPIFAEEGNLNTIDLKLPQENDSWDLFDIFEKCTRSKLQLLKKIYGKNDLVISVQNRETLDASIICSAHSYRLRIPGSEKPIDKVDFSEYPVCFLECYNSLEVKRDLMLQAYILKNRLNIRMTLLPHELAIDFARNRNNFEIPDQRNPSVNLVF